MAELGKKYCVYCLAEVSPLRFRCTECQDIELCPECFSAGAEIGHHRRYHGYQLVDGGRFTLWGPEAEGGWTSREEQLLLDAIEQFGFGNWVSEGERGEGERESERGVGSTPGRGRAARGPRHLPRGATQTHPPGRARDAACSYLAASPRKQPGGPLCTICMEGTPRSGHEVVATAQLSPHSLRASFSLNAAPLSPPSERPAHVRLALSPPGPQASHPPRLPGSLWCSWACPTTVHRGSHSRQVVFSPSLGLRTSRILAPQVEEPTPTHPFVKVSLSTDWPGVLLEIQWGTEPENWTHLHGWHPQPLRLSTAHTPLTCFSVLS